MSPEDALQMQIERYRQMTPAERMRIGLDLHDLACRMSMAGIKRQFPNATPEQWTDELMRRLEMARR
jgi:hypothetical protein